jgi:hypothetical protein
MQNERLGETVGAMASRSQHARQTKLLAWCALLLGCGADGSAPSEEPASTPSIGDVSYSFVASRRASEPAACGAYLLAMQLVFEDDLHKVRAVISSQSWECELHADAATYDITCISPQDHGDGVNASLAIVLFEPAPRMRIAGECTLTISTNTGSCEHSYTLDGQIER